MIPALIVPVYGRWDLTVRMMNSLTNVPDRVLLVDNKRDRPADLITEPNVIIHTPPYESMGWGGTLNFGITQMHDAPWWMWCTNDIILGRETMQTLYDVMQDAGDKPTVMTHRWAVGAINRAAIQTVGLFDEWSYHPIYFEDTDYAYRLHLAGATVLIDEMGVQEGIDGIEHSVTTRSDPVLSLANNRTWALNEAAYVAKWGGLPGKETFTSPWGKALPLWATRPDLDGRVLRRWPNQ